MTEQAISAIKGPDGAKRCWWCVGDSIYMDYHDNEWGVPCTDDRRLFENICLDGFQAGLSWITILKRRDGFRDAFKGFDIDRVARFNRRSVERLLSDERIIRHRGKIESAIKNARRARELIDEFGSLAAYIWRYEPRSRHPRLVTRTTLPATSVESIAMSKDLKRRGWSFVGPTILYAMMQAVGIVNDHVEDCDLRLDVEKARLRTRRPVVR